MNNNAIEQIKQIISENNLSEAEVLQIFNPKEKRADRFNFLKILNYVGGLAVFFGIGYIVSLYWTELGDLGQILTTLGVGIIAYIIAVLIKYSNKVNSFSDSIFLVASLLIPAGIFVTLDKLGTPTENFDLVIGIVFSVLALIYGVSDTKLKSSMITSFTWIYSIIGYGGVIAYLLPETGDNISRIYGFTAFIFATISIIVARLLINERSAGSKFIEFFAIPAYLISVATVIDGYLFLDILYLSIIFSIFYLGSKFNSTIYFINGFIALVIYLSYLNDEYFSSILGWPISLIITGIIIISTSTVLLKRKNNS